MKKIAVTGAFSFSGKYVTKLLLEKDYRVLTLTNHPQLDSSIYNKIETAKLNFEQPKALTQALYGCDTLVNTYWIRYACGIADHEIAVKNTRKLINAAIDASVRRIVHVSILNPSGDSKSPYYRGKTKTELEITSSGLSYAILRPAVLFGNEDILINNQAYFLRKFPIFVIPGDGRYRIRPIFVEDFAFLVVQSVESTKNYVIDAVGPEDYSFRDLVIQIKKTIESKSRVIHLPPRLAYLLSLMLGLIVKDKVLAWDEVNQLMSGVLSNNSSATGEVKLSEWLERNAKRIGRVYHSEISRHFADASR